MKRELHNWFRNGNCFFKAFGNRCDQFHNFINCRLLLDSCCHFHFYTTYKGRAYWSFRFSRFILFKFTPTKFLSVFFASISNFFSASCFTKNLWNYEILVFSLRGEDWPVLTSDRRQRWELVSPHLWDECRLQRDSKVSRSHFTSKTHAT